MEDHGQTSDASDKSLGPPDDFEDIRPKTKRSRAPEGTSGSVQRSQLRLMGKLTKRLYLFMSFSH